MCDSVCSILSFDILTKLCFICINQDYLKFRTRFLSISVNMINTNEADFLYDAKWRGTPPWGTPFCHFVSALKLLSGDRSQILRDVQGSDQFISFNSIQFNSVQFQQFGIFNSIQIQIGFRIFQFNSNSIHYLSIPILFNSNYMHRNNSNE